MKHTKEQPKIDLYWKARNFKPFNRSVDWYWFFWIVTIAIILLTLYFYQDRILAILVFLVAAISTHMSLRKPEIRQYKMDETGIYMNNGKKKILFDDIETYNIDKDNQYICLNTKNKYERMLEIPFEKNHNIDIIDSALESKIKKDEKLKMPFFEDLLRGVLGF